MAGHLIRLKLAMLRHQPGGWWTWKSWVGLLLALWSLAVVVSAPAEPGAMTSGLGFMLLVWILGAVVLSLQSGGGESLLLPAHFALLPIPPWRLATGLFAAAFASPFALILALALLAMPLGGVRLGVAAGAVSIVSFVLQVLFAVLLVRVVVDAASAAMRTRVGVTMVALQYALLISLSSVGWVLIGGFTTAGIGDWFQGNMPDALATLVRVLPTGWGAVAIGAAADGRWLLVVASLAALLALNGGLFFAWTRMLHRQLTDRPSASGARSRWTGPVHRLRTPMQAAIWREILRWLREPRSAIELRVAILTPILIACMPLLIGADILLPFMGVTVVVMAALTASNSYGPEGSALWLTLMAPDAVQVDVRSRQWAFLLLFAPLALVATVVPTLITGHHWAWPWLWSFVPGGLAVAAGVMILVAVKAAAPVPEAARRSGDLMSAGDAVGPAYLTLLLVGVLTAPGLVVTWIGVRDDDALVYVAGNALGLGIGIVTFWWCGRKAIGSLQAGGPEFLALLQHGPPERPSSPGEDEEGTSLQVSVVEGISWTLAMIAIFPQAVVPTVFKLIGVDQRVWFLPLYLPEAWQWAGIAGMFLVGAGLIWIAVTVRRRADAAA